MEKISDTDLILNPDGSVFHLGLVPDQLADLIIAVGDPGRVELVSRYFDSVEFRNQNREFITHTGTLSGKRLTVISTGIGSDNVEIFFQEVDALANIDLKRKEPRASRRSLSIIRVGTSGAMQKTIPVGSHLISDSAVGLDNLMNFYPLPQSEAEKSTSAAIQRHTKISFLPYLVKGSIPLRERIGISMISGNTVTCPGFYAPQGRKIQLPIRYPDLLDDLSSFRAGDFQPANFEMETATYFAFGRLMGHETASVNAIIANRVTGELSPNPHEVVDTLIKEVLERI